MSPYHRQLCQIAIFWGLKLECGLRLSMVLLADFYGIAKTDTKTFLQATNNFSPDPLGWLLWVWPSVTSS